MPEIEDIKTTFPDRLGIIDNLRNNKIHNPEFLELTLKAYGIRSELMSQQLAIEKLLQTNENVNIYDHQILAALKVKTDLGGTAMLADEVGLGKTIEAGMVIKEFLTTGLADKVLILSPPSLLSQWQSELYSKFSLDFVSQYDDDRFEDAYNHDLLIMSHSSAVFPNHSRALMETYWDLVVVDEAHSMKNPQTRKHRLVKDLLKRNLLLLTATPMQNNLKELYNLIELLRPGHLGTWGQFEDRYVRGSDNRSFNPAFREELQKILSKTIIRTRRQEVKAHIPFGDRIPHTKILEPAENEALLYNSITDILRGIYFEMEKSFSLMIYQRLASSSAASSRNALYRMRVNEAIDGEEYDRLASIADGIRADTKLLDLAGLVRKDDSKFLVFTEFYATQDYVAGCLMDRGHSVVLFNGKMGTDEKNEAVRRFKDDAQIMVSAGAGGEGRNFQFCRNIVNYDLPWNPMRVEQRIGRVHRIGQKNDVNIFNYALSGTMDAYILEMLYAKIGLFQMALGDMDLLFEDSWRSGSSHTWFKEYMNGKDNRGIRSRFSSLGDDWAKRKTGVNGAIHGFNGDVFANFDLSVLQENRDRSVK